MWARPGQDEPGRYLESLASVTKAVGAPCSPGPQPHISEPGRVPASTLGEDTARPGGQGQPRGEGPAAVPRSSTAGEPRDPVHSSCRCGPGSVCVCVGGGVTPRWDCAKCISLLCPPDLLSFMASGERPGRKGKGRCWGLGFAGHVQLLRPLPAPMRPRPPAAVAPEPRKGPSQPVPPGGRLWQAPLGSAVARWAHLFFKPSQPESSTLGSPLGVGTRRPSGLVGPGHRSAW